MNPATTPTAPVVWRSAMMFKKGSKVGHLFGRSNWKPRFLVLTTDAILYYTAPGGKLKGKIDLTKCSPSDIEEMPHDGFKTGTSASSIWRISIQTPGRRYMIAATNPGEMNVWFDDLQKITAHGSCRSIDQVDQMRQAVRQARLRVPKAQAIWSTICAGNAHCSCLPMDSDGFVSFTVRDKRRRSFVRGLNNARATARVCESLAKMTTAEEDAPLKSGMLFKKGKRMLGLFGRANWKPRYAVLTPKALTYYTAPSGKLKGRIDLNQVSPNDIDVMPRECLKTGKSKSSIWRIAIQTPKRRFFIATQSAMEMNAWAIALANATKHNALV
ncbi:unnamed protein product [Aphanomyces euteiches]